MTTQDPTALEPRLRASLGWIGKVTIVLGCLLSAFLVVPIIAILPASLTSGEFIQFPPDGLSMRWYKRIATDPQWTSAFSQSLRYSLAAAAIAVVIGTLAAVGLRRLNRSVGWAQALFMIPLILPLVTYAVGLSTTVNALRVDPNSPWPTIVGQGTLAVPLVFISVSAGLATIDSAGVRAAQSMGASWVRVVREVELPQVWPSILAGGALAFAFCFDEIVVALFLSSEAVSTLPVQIYQTVRQSVSPDVAAASTVVVGLAVLVAALGALGQWARARRLNRGSRS